MTKTEISVEVELLLKCSLFLSFWRGCLDWWHSSSAIKQHHLFIFCFSLSSTIAVWFLWFRGVIISLFSWQRIMSFMTSLGKAHSAINWPNWAPRWNRVTCTRPPYYFIFNETRSEGLTRVKWVFTSFPLSLSLRNLGTLSSLSTRCNCELKRTLQPASESHKFMNGESHKFLSHLLIQLPMWVSVYQFLVIRCRTYWSFKQRV